MENAFFNISEEVLPILRAKGYKICPWRRIVVAFQPDAAPMVDIGVIRHISLLSIEMDRGGHSRGGCALHPIGLGALQ